VQGGWISRFCWVAAALSHSCNSGWSAPHPAMWGSSVLSAVLSPMRLVLGPTIPSFGKLSCYPISALSLCYFFCLHSLRVQLLAPPVFFREDSVFHPTPAVSVRLQFAVYAFQFCCWGAGGSICLEMIQSAQGLHWIMFSGDGREGSPTRYLLLTCCVCRFMQTALKLAGGEKWHATFLKADTSWDWVQCCGT
jgi:hypothetical protein